MSSGEWEQELLMEKEPAPFLPPLSLPHSFSLGFLAVCHRTSGLLADVILEEMRRGNMMQPLVSSLSSRDDITRERRNVSNENTTKTLFLVPSGARQPGVTTASSGYGVKNTL